MSGAKPVFPLYSADNRGEVGKNYRGRLYKLTFPDQATESQQVRNYWGGPEKKIVTRGPKIFLGARKFFSGGAEKIFHWWP